MSQSLDVFVADQFVGVLQERVDTGLVDFEYRTGTPAQWAASLLMPPEAPPEDYRDFNGLPPPFEVSLPEGMLLEAIRSRFGKLIDVSSDFDLLRLVGRHTIGRVTFGGPLERADALDEQILAAARSEHSATRLAEILRAEPQMFGLSGVMPKMSAYEPHALRPGTLHSRGLIVKFDSPNYPGASLVEYACLRACAAVDLVVPMAELSPDRASLTIERFDVDDRGGRLGFEDACALSGIRRAGKYNGSIQHLFDMIGHFVHPDDQPGDRLALLKLLIMNDVLRNGDAHLKNFGLLYSDVDRPRLAPVYDVLTTQVWIHGDTPAMAMRKGGEPGTWFDHAGALQSLAEMAQLPAHQIADLYDHCADKALQSLQQTLAEQHASGGSSALERVVEIVASHLGDMGAPQRGRI